MKLEVNEVEKGEGPRRPDRNDREESGPKFIDYCAEENFNI